MRNQIFTLLLLLLPAWLHAQVADVVFIGSITTKDGQNFSYKLQFSDSNGRINGYSITDVMGPNETKTLVTGTINSSQKQIKFKETKVVRSKVGAGSTLCFMNATLKASTRKGTTILKGTFKGYTDKNVECSEGKLVLVSAKDVMSKLMQSNMKKDSTAIRKVFASESIEPAKKETKAEPAIISIPPGTTREFVATANTAKISIWDASNIDGDMVTVLHNGKVILSSYTLSGDSKDLAISLTGNDVIQVVANNEGSEPFNTARMKIVTGADTYLVDASTTVDKPVSVVLKKGN